MNRTRVSNNEIISDVYYKRDINSESCLFLYGYPATIGENVLTEHLVDKNLLVFQPHYPGTYDSGGKFSPNTCIQMVSKLEYSLNHKNTIDLKSMSNITINQFKYAFANSFGCFIALNSLQFLNSVEKLFLFAPAITYGKAKFSSGFIESGIKFVDYVKKTRPYTYRMGSQDQWGNFYEGKLNNSSKIENSNIKEVIGIVGSNDKSFNLDTFKLNFENIVRGYIKHNVVVKLIVVESGSHSLKSLFNSEVISELNKL